jgi:hypothetical protein
MSRFHFDLHAEGKTTSDPSGLELQDQAAAERYALNLIEGLASVLFSKGGDFERAVEIRTNKPVARIVLKSKIHRF